MSDEPLVLRTSFAAGRRDDPDHLADVRAIATCPYCGAFSVGVASPPDQGPGTGAGKRAVAGAPRCPDDAGPAAGSARAGTPAEACDHHAAESGSASAAATAGCSAEP